VRPDNPRSSSSLRNRYALLSQGGYPNPKCLLIPPANVDAEEVEDENDEASLFPLLSESSSHHLEDDEDDDDGSVDLKADNPETLPLKASKMES
jgi:hypothetical protein